MVPLIGVARDVYLDRALMWRALETGYLLLRGCLWLLAERLAGNSSSSDPANRQVQSHLKRCRTESGISFAKLAQTPDF